MEDRKELDIIEKFEKPNNIQRMNSFSKEFISIEDNIEKDSDTLSQSSRNQYHLTQMEEKVLGKSKGSCPTVFDEKIRKQLTSKGLKTTILKIIAGQKDMKKLKNMSNTIYKNDNHNTNINKDDFLQIRKIPKISNEEFEKTKRQITFNDN